MNTLCWLLAMFATGFGLGFVIGVAFDSEPLPRLGKRKNRRHVSVNPDLIDHDEVERLFKESMK